MDRLIKEVIGSGLKKEIREEVCQIIDQTNLQEVDQMIYSMEIALKVQKRLNKFCMMDFGVVQDDNELQSDA